MCILRIILQDIWFVIDIGNIQYVNFRLNNS